MKECIESMIQPDCKKTFEDIVKELRHLNELMSGQNGVIGLLEKVRNLEKINRYQFIVISGMAVIIFGQFIKWLFDKI